MGAEMRAKIRVKIRLPGERVICPIFFAAFAQERADTLNFHFPTAKVPA
jgi:hypothetical protein